MEAFEFEGQRVDVALHAHAAGDDLLSAGLGLAGLQAPPTVPVGPLDWSARRRRAVRANWQGIAFLAEPDAALCEALAQPVSGRELHAQLAPAGAPPHRVMLQIPEHFDPLNPRLLVTASSGSRGIFGALPVAGPWGLPRGWAIVYTDKGCGCDWYDVEHGVAPDLLGAMTEDPALQMFRPDAGGAPAHAVLIPHAHSAGHPEAHWGRYVRQAARFGWAVLDRLFAPQRPSLSPRRRCIALGLSNGGAAVLRALERPAGFDGAVALAPNVLPGSGGRAFLDYAAEAALWLPLALQRPESGADRPSAPAVGSQAIDAQAEASARALRALGHRAADPRGALRHLRRRGWPLHTLRSTRLTTLFDFWYAAGHTYAPALARAGPAAHPLGSHFAVRDAQGLERPSRADERDLWWSDGAGIVPGAGVGIVEPKSREQQLVRLWRLLHGARRDPRMVRGIEATRCAPPTPGVPLVLIHGASDGLIPAAFSSLPYARLARAAGREVRLECPPDAPHFDAFLAVPGHRDGLAPLLPHAGPALDALARRLGAG